MKALGIGKTKAGKDSNPNENAMHIDNELGLYVVSDGIGDLPSGEVASSIAVKAIGDYIKDNAHMLEKIRSGTEPEDKAVHLVNAAMQYANEEVYEATIGNDSHTGMGCTATMVLILGQKAVMAHVGNTRLYLVRKPQVHQISSDHTMAADYLRKGIISEVEALMNRYRKVLTHSMGTYELTHVDTLLFDLLPGDLLLLVSNGLTPVVSDSSTVIRILEGGFTKMAEKLVQTAIIRRLEEDVTAIVIRPADEVAETEDNESETLPLDRCFSVLSSVWLFNELTLRKLQRVLNHSSITFYDEGDIVARETDTSPGMIVVLEGIVEVRQVRGMKGVLATGDAAEETALISEHPARGTYKALTTTHILTIDKKTFQKLTHRNPRLGITLYRRLCERFAQELDSRDTPQLLLTKAGIGMLTP